MSAEAPLERERRLQRYRNHFGAQDPVWNAEDLSALEWIDALAESGHFGAIRLLARTLRGEDVLKRLHACSPGKLERLAARLPRVAFFLVLAECDRERPDTSTLERWLSHCDGVLPRFAAAVGDLRASGAVMGQADGAAMRKLLEVYWHQGTEWNFGFHGPDDLLMAFARPRIASAGLPEQAAGVALVKRAYELGNYDARQHVWRAHFRAAEDKHGFYRKWLADSGNPSDLMRRACIEHGAALERASGGSLEALAEAATWYWRALFNHTIAQRPNLLQDAGFCERVGEAFDAGKKEWMAKLDDVELSKAWHQRAAALKRSS